MGTFRRPFRSLAVYGRGVLCHPLYVRALEPLGCAIRSDPKIYGIKLPGREGGGGTEAKVMIRMYVR